MDDYTNVVKIGIKMVTPQSKNALNSKGTNSKQ